MPQACPRVSNLPSNLYVFSELQYADIAESYLELRRLALPATRPLFVSGKPCLFTAQHFQAESGVAVASGFSSSISKRLDCAGLALFPVLEQYKKYVKYAVYTLFKCVIFMSNFDFVIHMSSIRATKTDVPRMAGSWFQQSDEALSSWDFAGIHINIWNQAKIR
jgi:hypothetical protein